MGRFDGVLLSENGIIWYRWNHILLCFDFPHSTLPDNKKTPDHNNVTLLFTHERVEAYLICKGVLWYRQNVYWRRYHRNARIFERQNFCGVLRDHFQQIAGILMSTYCAPNLVDNLCTFIRSRVREERTLRLRSILYELFNNPYFIRIT